MESTEPRPLAKVAVIVLGIVTRPSLKNMFDSKRVDLASLSCLSDRHIAIVGSSLCLYFPLWRRTH